MKAIFLVLVCSMVVGCQTTRKFNWSAEDLLISKSIDLHPPKGPLTVSQVERDKSYLTYALENGYGGRKYAPHDAYELALKKIEAISGPVGVEAFKNLVDEALLTIPDNHLKARINGEPSDARKKISKSGTVGKNAISSKNKIWEASRKRYGNTHYAYVSITTLPSHKDAVWNHFISKAKESLKKTAFAIVDLRGNGGGDDTMGIKLAEVFNGGPVRYPITKQYISQTPETLAIFMNLFNLRTLKLQEKGESVPPYFSDLLREKRTEYKQALKGDLPAEKIEQEDTEQYTFNKATGYKNPIFILMDGACGSSCESTIDAFEWIPSAKKVGQNTAGYIHFGNIGYIVLPESKIQVQIPTHYNEYFDKRFIERVGLTPDFIVPPGTDALNYTLNNLISK